MRYSTHPKFEKYVEGYGFLSFARKFSHKYGKKLMDTETETGIDLILTQKEINLICLLNKSNGITDVLVISETKLHESFPVSQF